MNGQAVKHRLRGVVRRFGYDIVPFSPRGSLAGLLRALFAASNVNCVFDVGAHYGEYGQFLRELGYTGRIISFEPVGASFAILQRRCRADPNWTALRMALGSSDSERAINVMHNTTLSSFLTPSEYSKEWGRRWHGHDDEIERTEIAEVRRVDSVFGACVKGLAHPRVYLKMDTQGWDLEVLAGASSCLASIAALQSEVSVQPIYDGMPNYVESIAAMNQLGFEVAGMFPVIHDYLLRAVEFDCVMVSTGRQPSARDGDSVLATARGSVDARSKV